MEKVFDRKAFTAEFNLFFEKHKEQILSEAIRLEDLPEDDDWRNDDLWTEYQEDDIDDE